MSNTSLKIKVKRYTIETPVEEVLKLIKKTSKIYHELGQMTYVKKIGQTLGLKEHEIYTLIQENDIPVHKGKKTGKLIFTQLKNEEVKNDNM